MSSADRRRSLTGPADHGRRVALAGGGILLALGIVIVAIAIEAATAEPVEGLDFGRAIAPFAFGFAVPPLVAAVGIIRDHRSADVLGVIVGLSYGALLLAQGTRGGSPLAIVGLAAVMAAVLLLDSFRRRASRR
jgi:hypothetical protein